MGLPQGGPGQPLLCPLVVNGALSLCTTLTPQPSLSAGDPRPCLTVSCGPKQMTPPQLSPSPVVGILCHPCPCLPVPLKIRILLPAQSHPETPAPLPTAPPSLDTSSSAFKPAPQHQQVALPHSLLPLLQPTCASFRPPSFHPQSTQQESLSPPVSDPL